MKKIVSFLLTLCLLLGALPAQALAFAGDILPASGTVEQVKLDDGSLSLQNDYIHVTLRKLWGTYAYLTVVPAAKTDEENLFVSQTPYCNFFTYDQGKEKTEGVLLTPEKEEFVTGTPNDPNARAIKVEYSLLSAFSWVTAKATVYYELVQLKEHGSAKNDTWGVLASVSSPLVDEKSMQAMDTDFGFRWGFSINNFTATGHISTLEKPGGPAIKMSQTTVPEVKEGESLTTTTESVVFTAPVEKLDTTTIPKGYRLWGEIDGVYITEVYTDGYLWANPFVGLSDYYSKEIVSSGPGSNPIRVNLPQYVSVQPGDKPLDTWVQCESHVGFDRIGEDADPSQEYVPTYFHNYLWGFHDLIKAGAEEVPTAPDTVKPSIHAKRLAAFASGGGVTVEYVADDAALEALKKQYGASPVALISGDYESANGEAFTFTGGAALLSASVTATWNKDSGKLVIHRDGTVEQSGVHLSAPTFKFYQPKSGAEGTLMISLMEKGFEFTIDPDSNEAIVFVDIPYATVKLERATADAAGNLVFTGNIGFQTLFGGAEFSMEKLGYGLNAKNKFKVNGVKATGSFDTAKLMALELAKVSGEVNTFKGEERYAFELELNVFDLFETEAKLALERSKKDGSLIPDELWFFVKANPGIPLIPPIPIGQLNGGGAGFKDLAKTVNGNYFAIPPLKLRGALAGTYLHLIEGRGDVVLGPSEISLKATDVGIVGLGKAGQVIDSFGYSLQLNGQERDYRGTTYKGIYFVGSEELTLNLPNKTVNAIVLDSSIKLGAFGGVNNAKDRVYLGVGANGVVKGRVQIPNNVPLVGGLKVASADVDLIVGGQTTFPIRSVSVSDGMKQAFNNVDIYLGAMTTVGGWLASARVWVLVPQIVHTRFRMGSGWDIEVKAFGYMPEWDWSSKGVTPLVQAVSLAEGGEELPMLMALEPISLEDGGENDLMLMALEPAALRNGGGKTADFPVTANQGETPYIVLAFDNSIADADIQNALTVAKDNNPVNINWIANNGEINPACDINGTIIANMKKAQDDGKEYRMVILRLKEGGSYSVSTTNGLSFSDEKSFAVEPFESLSLTQNGNFLSGAVAHPAAGTTYTLRTYLGSNPDEATYLVDEQIVDPSNITVSIPTEGTLMPTGSYYVTSFLMAEKTTTVNDGNGNPKEVTVPAAIASQKLPEQVSYRNTNPYQPEAPASVRLAFTGNEVMRAEWTKVDGANGYRVTIYQLDTKGNWINTGFGYDVDGDTTSIDMALTVGGNAVSVNGSSAVSVPAENLSANQTYKVGVSAYKLVPTGLEESESTNTEGENTENTGAAVENALNPNKAFQGAKYYSTEAESNDGYLPEYTPLDISLAVNSDPCIKDENGVFHAYVGSNQPPMLTARCATSGVSYKVTRMDTNDEITADSFEEYLIPDFTGSLMLKIEGRQGSDVTSVFLLVNRDETPPVLTLSDPIFYADTDSGAYQITGTADAGSQILYQDDEGAKSVYAAGDGSFTINGVLDEGASSDSLYLRAQDSAGNLSKQQLALVARQAATYSVTVNGSYAESSGAGDYTANSTVTVRAGVRSGYTFNGWTSDSGVTFADASAEETTFTMPDKNVTVTANWMSSGSPSGGGDSGAPVYPVTAEETKNGTVTISPKNAPAGSTVTITVKPDSGYVLESITATGKNGSALPLTDRGNGKYTLTMPAGEIRIKASFMEDNSVLNLFYDVPNSAYYYEAVKWAVKNGITGGVGNNLFAPGQPCTRAQIVTLLWRAAGSPEPKALSSFTDVAPDAYYAKAVAWAIENGITTGTAAAAFSPDDTCTRAQAVTFLARALNAEAANSALSFTDVAADAYYAKAVAWAVENGVTDGVGSGLFAPNEHCTRGQIVTFLWRAYRK